MARFTTRVELHKAADVDYDKLHTAMKARGFSQTIKHDTSGKVYHLPTAEYNYIGEKSSTEVLDLAKAAAVTTGKKSSILVTKSGGRVWDNLEEA